eukprot:gene2406-2870_t
MKRGRNFNNQNTNYKKQKQQDFNLTREEKIDALFRNPHSDVVDFNSLISEFASHKHFDMALLTFETILKKKLRPTIVTYSSLMNACVRCGENEKAQQYHDDMISEGIQPNEITYTTLIKGIAEDNCNEAFNILEEMKDLNVTPNLRTMNALLRGCLNSGNIKIAKKVFEKMQILKIEPDLFSYHYLIQCLCHNDEIKEAMKQIGNLEKIKSKYGVISTSYIAISKSCALHGDQLNSEKYLKLSENFLKKEKMEMEQGNMFLKFQNEEAERECQEIKKYLKTFSKEKFEFTNSPNVILKPKDHIKFKKVFDLEKPMYLEICSGAGEWMIEKAKSDKEINWTSLEMRNDRNFSIFTNMVFQDVKNVLVVAGEANKTLNENFRKRSMDKIFINFPNPPIWKDSKQILINQPFLEECHRVLKKDSSIIVVTDNHGYAMLIVEAFEALVDKKMFKSNYGSEMYSNEIPNDYGSSYFDRFWSHGNHTERFCMNFIKLGK